MSQNSNKTEDSSSRFDHKSQGMRSRSKSRAQTFSEAKVLEEETAGSEAETETGAEAENASVHPGAQKVFEEDSFEKNPSIAKAQERFAAAFAAAGEDDETVIINKSDIPAYEIGITSDEFYVPEEIQKGKVSKISEEQFEEIAAREPKKKRKKRRYKKKTTPLQKVLKAVIWVAVWLIVFLIAAVAFRITYNVFYDIAVDPDSTTTIEYTVTADATDESVYADLEALGVMNCSEFIYKLRAKVFDADYIEGTYYVSDGYNIEKIINILSGYNYSDD